MAKVGRITAALGGDAMSAPVSGLSEGIYTVKWVAYGSDGHTVEGSFEFGVPSANGQAPPGAQRLLATTTASAESAPTESLVSVFGRWLAAIAAFVLLGAAALIVCLRTRTSADLAEEVQRRWLVLAPWGLALALAGTVLEAAERADASTGFKLSLLSSAITGVAIIVRLAALALAVPLSLALRRRMPGLRTAVYGVAGAIALGALAIDGHVATVRHLRVLAAAGQMLHLLSAGLWMGAAITIAVCLVPAARARGRGGELAAGVRSYAPVAIGAAAVTIVTGVIAAVREVNRWYFLRWSTYGHLVVIKVVVVGLVLVVGAVSTLLARRALRRALGHPRAAGGLADAHRGGAGGGDDRRGDAAGGNAAGTRPDAALTARRSAPGGGVRRRRAVQGNRPDDARSGGRRCQPDHRGQLRA